MCLCVCGVGGGCRDVVSKCVCVCVWGGGIGMWSVNVSVCVWGGGVSGCGQ